MDEMPVKDGTGQALVAFFDYVAEKGLMNRNTAGAMRAAVKEVLAVEADDLSSIDLDSLDIDGLLRRFENLRKQKFKPDSLHVYQTRFRKAIQLYTDYLADPSGWRPPMRERTQTPTAEVARNEKPKQRAAPRGSASPQLMEYPFPIREGVVARLHLPIDLRKGEAQRLGVFLNSLAIEQQAALPAGSEDSTNGQGGRA
jgi:hypothetical protein